jgi:UDP-glucose 4-epimerase
MAGTRPHVVFASSRLVYGPVSELPVSEEATVAPRSAYAAHKLCVEHYHQIAALREKITFSICRISNPYGFFDQRAAKAYGFINNLIQRGCRKEPLTIYGDGEQIRDYIHISDLLEALRLCGSESGARNQIFNIGCGQGISVAAAAEEVRNLTGAPVLRVPWPAEELFVESGDYVAGIQKARTLLGFDPRMSFRDGLRKLLSGRMEGHLHKEDGSPVSGDLVRTGAWA